MADRGVGSSLRRLCASTGALVALGLVLAVSAAAAAPSPDPPPLPAPPKPKTEPVQPTVTVVVRQAPVVTPAPVVRRPAPVVTAPVQRAKPKPAPARVKRAVKPKAPAPVARPPHDRHRVPLVALVASPPVDSVDRDLLALAGFGLLLVALGGSVVLLAARRQLRGELA